MCSDAGRKIPLMRKPAALLLFLSALFAPPVLAQDGADRFVQSAPAAQTASLRAYGPFKVVDASHAVMDGVTDERSPAQFAAMLQDFPQITTLTMQECPGTFDDRANLKVGRMIRAAGIVTYVPAGGSVRSGGVELFLAGVERRIDDGAEFAVHAWEDDAGLEASDYAVTAPENRKYLAYYREMGMSEGEASAFYAMTNSVPHEQARWLDAAEMRRWLGQNGSMTETAAAPPRLAYLDLNALLN